MVRKMDDVGLEPCQALLESRFQPRRVKDAANADRANPRKRFGSYRTRKRHAFMLSQRVRKVLGVPADAGSFFNREPVLEQNSHLFSRSPSQRLGQIRAALHKRLPRGLNRAGSTRCEKKRSSCPIHLPDSLAVPSRAVCGHGRCLAGAPLDRP